MEDKKVEELKSAYGCDNKHYTRHELEKLVALSLTLLKYKKLELFPVIGIQSVEGKYHLFKKEDNTWESYLCVDCVATKRTNGKDNLYFCSLSLLENILNVNEYDRTTGDYFDRFCDIDVSDKDLELFTKVYIDRNVTIKEYEELLELLTCFITRYDDESVKGRRYYRQLFNYEYNAHKKEFGSFTRHELEYLYSLKVTRMRYRDKSDNEDGIGLHMNADSLSGGTYIIKNPLGCFELFDVDDERKYLSEPREVYDSCERACIAAIYKIIKSDKRKEAIDFFYRTFDSNISDEELDNFRYFFLTGWVNRTSDISKKDEREIREKQYNLSLKKRGVVDEN